MQRGIGDVLIAWENEALLAIKELGPGKFEIVAPSLSILAEPPVAVVDKVAGKHGTKAVAQAYLEYLYTDAGQEIAAKHFYRPRSATVAAKYASQFPKVQLVTVDEVFGGWKKAQATHFADGGCSTRSTSRGASPGARLPLRRDDDAANLAKRAARVRSDPGHHLHYLSLIVLLPLATVFTRTADLSWPEFWSTVTNPRVLASYRLTFGASFVAACVNTVFGLLVAWVLVRYRFPGRKLVDALVDLPFALPTAVAGIALTTLYAGNGWLGRSSSRSESRCPTPGSASPWR